jgi:hypothetical protein
MHIELKKFGDILTSREAGREALLAYTPTLNTIDKNEEIIVDFRDVSVLTPSWADEFLRPILLLKKYAQKVSLINDSNPSVQSALRFANPKLDLNKITVFQDVLVFGEIMDDAIYDANRPRLMLTFPYSDEEALLILKNNNVKKTYLHPVDALRGSSRLKTVAEMLNRAGIEALTDK